MPVTIHLVRHAQGLHNISRANEDLHDPQLTELGLQQCAELRAQFPYHGKITRFLSSPLRRTLSTCLLSFASASEENGNKYPPVIAIPEFQEVSDAPCDTGNSAAILEKEFHSLVDLSRLNDEWNVPPAWTTWKAKVEATQKRASRARTILKELLQDAEDNDHVVLVSHGAFLHFFTNEYQGVQPLKATSWSNTEYRSYHFADSDDGNHDVQLIETPESWKRRHGDEPRPSAKGQEELREFYYKQLEPYVTPTEHGGY